jgi:hypothetical protein
MLSLPTVLPWISGPSRCRESSKLLGSAEMAAVALLTIVL